MSDFKEPILRSSLQIFLRMFFAILGLALGLFLVGVIYSFFSQTSHSLEERTAIEIAPDASNQRELVHQHAPVILEIKIHGVIGGPDGPNAVTSENIENILLDSRVRLLDKNRVKAILLHFNTPGGSVFDSDNIYRMLLDYKARYQVPIFGYVDGLCASGGMYIASAADRIFAAPSSVIGSVGVISGPFFNVYETLQKVGIQALTLTEGIGKDSLNPTRPWSPSESKSHQALIAHFYQRFVNIVTSARPRLNRHELLYNYGAKVFDCITAEEYGYIDVANSSRNEALLALLQEAHIDPTSPYQVVELKNNPTWFSQIIKGQSALFPQKIEHALDLGVPKLEGPCAYLYVAPHP